MRTLCHARSPWLRNLLLATIAPWLSLVLANATEPAPGQQQIIPIKTAKGEVQLVFRYCPEGKTYIVKPEPLPKPSGNAALDRVKQKGRTAELKGFYIAETETSQLQYRQVLGDAANKIVDQKYRNDKKPVFPVTIEQAAQFCRELNRLSEEGPQDLSQLEARRFCLPTLAQWQYACRARRTTEEQLRVPHFSCWPTAEDMKGTNEWQDAVDAYKDINKQAVFTGDQAQIVEILAAPKKEDADKKKKAIEILARFLKAGGGIDHPIAKTPTDIAPIGTLQPNAWMIKNMHGNVCEWVVAGKSQEEAENISRDLSMTATVSSQDGRYFALSGAGFGCALSTNTTEWMKFAIWGGEPWNSEENRIDPWNFATANSKTATELSPGFRIVMVRSLAPLWLASIRRQVIGTQTIDPKVLDSLAKAREAISELSDGSIALPILDYYKSLAQRRLGEKVAFTSPDEKTPEDDKAYMTALSKISKCD